VVVSFGAEARTVCLHRKLAFDRATGISRQRLLLSSSHTRIFNSHSAQLAYCKLRPSFAPPPLVYFATGQIDWQRRMIFGAWAASPSPLWYFFPHRYEIDLWAAALSLCLMLLVQGSYIGLGPPVFAESFSGSVPLYGASLSINHRPVFVAQSRLPCNSTLGCRGTLAYHDLASHCVDFVAMLSWIERNGLS